MDFHTRSANKLLVLFLIIGLFAQLHFVDTKHEPYPLILLPGGGNVIENSDELAYSRYQFVAYSIDRKQESVEQFDLLDTVPAGYSLHITKNLRNLYTRKSVNAEVLDEGRVWLRKKLKKITSLNQISKLEIKNASYNIYLSNNKIDSIRTKDIFTIATIELSEDE